MTVWRDFQDRISGTDDWTQKSYPITGSGSHTLKWRYVKNGWTSYYYDCGWVDYVQWSGVLDHSLPTDWTTISYTYDPAGRRTLAPSLVARDSSLECRCADCRGCVPDVRQRNSVHPSTSNHQSSIILHQFPSRVIALSDTAGEAAVLYEYSIYGQTAASDPGSHW